MIGGQKGITLVALVITIIVMLILAGAAFAVLNNQGNILTRSENAVQKYNDKANTADNLVDQLDDLLNKWATTGNQ